jgi:hypothetical protein
MVIALIGECAAGRFARASITLVRESAMRGEVSRSIRLSEAPMDNNIRREERVQLLRFTIALILFVCALHMLCSRDNQAALAQIQQPHARPVSAIIQRALQSPAKVQAMATDAPITRTAL